MQAAAAFKSNAIRPSLMAKRISDNRASMAMAIAGPHSASVR